MRHFFTLLALATRHVLVHRANLLIGTLVVFSTFVLVVIGALSRNVSSGAQRSVTDSFVGHVQVFTRQFGREPVMLPPFPGGERAGKVRPIADFAALEKALLEVDNVRAVVPEGVLFAEYDPGNLADRALERLREHVREQAKRGEAIFVPESLTRPIRHLSATLAKQTQAVGGGALVEGLRENQAVLQQFAEPAFWADFDQHAQAKLEMLDNQLAPAFPDEVEQSLTLLGTNLERAKEGFGRLRVVDGAFPEAGTRSLLLTKFAYEDTFKLKVARGLDLIHEAVSQGARIDEDPELQSRVNRLPDRVGELLLQLDEADAPQAVARLQAGLGTGEGDLEKLLSTLLTVNEQNVGRHHALFYEQLAPLLELYSVPIGGTLVLRRVGQSGFSRAVRVTLAGTYVIEGLGAVDSVAQTLNLIDEASYAVLFGALTPEEAEEVAQMLEEQAQPPQAAADGADAAAFIEEREKSIRAAAESHRASMTQKLPSPFLHAAIVLDDPARIEETSAALERIIEARGLDVEVVRWDDAAGGYGAISNVLSVLLFFAVSLIFVLIAIVVSNATIVGTLRRVREFGTFRAIGAQRGFVLMGVLLEGLLLSVASAVIGGALGIAALEQLGALGIPAAGNPLLVMLFSGSTLHVEWSSLDLLKAGAVTILVSVAACLYPALLAARTSPRRAMESES